MTSVTVTSFTPEILYSAVVQVKVENYNERKNVGYGTFIRSPSFTVGGYEWTLNYFPDGCSEQTEGHVSVALEFMGTENINLWVIIGLTFAGKVDRSAWGGWATATFLNSNNDFTFNWPEFRCEVLEEMGLVQNDCLEIQCEISVCRPNQLLQAGLLPEVEVPASDMLQNLGRFMKDHVAADVAFMVEQETFQAHRIMLAACSPVFDKQLNGQMREKDMGCVQVHDMQPAVFQALLHFVYTDTMIDMSDKVVGDQIELIRHLLVAADRYCMDRLKNICEGILCKCVDMESLLTTVGLADQYHCMKLLDACVEFLKYSSQRDMVESQWYLVLKETNPDVATQICKDVEDVRKFIN